jgi:hypothetical protein
MNSKLLRRHRIEQRDLMLAFGLDSLAQRLPSVIVFQESFILLVELFQLVTRDLRIETGTFMNGCS